MDNYKVISLVCAVLCTWVYYIAHADETGASDEESKLQQALLIVKLLKSEFPRLLLRENNINILEDVTAENSLTCATTTSIDKSINFRRFGSHDHGGRRFQYDDIFGAHPKTTSTNSPSTLNTSTSTTEVSSALNTATTTGAYTTAATTTTTGAYTTAATTTTTYTTAATTTTTYTAATSKQEPTRLTSHTHTTDLTTLLPITSTKLALQKVMLSLSKTTKKTTETTSNNEDKKQSIDTTTETNVNKQNTKQTVSLTNKSSTVDPNLSQVAAELEKELASGLNVASRKFRTLWRGTTKIHLAGSTRYPIPLPENHAFCYTNPRNALCRTYIG